MFRLVIKSLNEWKQRERRKPLIIRGARQVGKTWAIEEFGKSEYSGVCKIDFEKRPDIHMVFEGSLEPGRIIEQLELLLDMKIRSEETLLFFDEVQACPRALLSLRYFYEEMPEQHLIATGSLLDFALEEISFPVGRVQFLNMYPMNFVEFLTAMGKKGLAQKICEHPESLPESIHFLLLDELKTYLWVGGMPEAVKTYLDTHSVLEAFQVHDEIVNAYRADFPKYAPRADKTCLDMVFRNTAEMLGEQVKYSRLAEGFSNPTVHKAFDLLEKAKVLNRITASDPSGLPLGAGANHKKFKASIVDVGLMQRLCQIPVDKESRHTDLLAIYRGKLAEQFVAQELLASRQEDLYYWAREKRGSCSEVDFLVVQDGLIIPIEVKSGAGGSLKSMHNMLSRYPGCPGGIVLYSGNYTERPEQNLTFIPLYYAGNRKSPVV